MVTTAKSARSRAPRRTTVRRARRGSRRCRSVTGRPSRSEAARARSKLADVQDGRPEDMPARACRRSPARRCPPRRSPTSRHAGRGGHAVEERLGGGRGASRDRSPRVRAGRPRWRARLPAKIEKMTAVCSRSDSFMPTTRCARARTPSATGGRPRAGFGAVIAGPSPPREARVSISSEVIVVTEAGLTPSSFATCTRGMRPAGADAFEDLLAERAHRFGQRRDQRAAAAAGRPVRTARPLLAFSASYFLRPDAKK
jgi:hypothetical protein